MKLPNDEIGISDILAWRECARRMSFGMRRHTEQGEAPEAASPSTAYGTAVHEVFSAIEREGLTDDEAAQRAFDNHGRWLEPEHLNQLKRDLEVYHEREYVGVTTVLNEGELRMPILEHEGRTIYFRGKVDRLYQSTENPTVFIHVDYKSSAHRRAEVEVHNDLQMWAYNVLLHDVYPEIETLVQDYDQLRFGVVRTRKNEDQREQMREWLVRQVTAVLNDENWQEDGLLEPTHNRWCPWCPIMESCPVVGELSEYALSQIEALAPQNPGEKAPGLDPDLFSVYVSELDRVGAASKVLDRFDKKVREALREMPEGRLAELGYESGERSGSVWNSQALSGTHSLVGDHFYEMVKLTKGAVDALEDKPLAESVMALASKVETPVLKRRRAP